MTDCLGVSFLTQDHLQSPIPRIQIVSLGQATNPSLWSVAVFPYLLRTSSYHLLGPADTIVKVPEMAESITEGTLKQFSKREHPDYSPL